MMSDGDNLDRLAAAGRASAKRRGAQQSSVVRQFRQAAGFDELDQYDKIQKMRQFSEALGVDSPFYREHDARCGATTMIAGQKIDNFASYDYLGLNGDVRLAKVAHAAIDHYGISPSASRLVAGERAIHRHLEQALARHYATEAAVTFVSGHATNVSTIGELLGPNDLILHDSFIHNSVLVGAQLSGATRRAFDHNNPESLRLILSRMRDHHSNVLIVIEGLYSMDGDTAPLAEIIEIKKEFGCWLMVDEAHGLGTLGATGKGIFEQKGVDPTEIDIWMGTLSKTLASTGGYVCGSGPLIDVLKANAGGFVFSVGLAPVLAASALEALELVHTEPERVAKLHANTKLFLDLAQESDLDTGSAEPFAIIPIMVGDSLRATRLCNAILARGINALPIIYPAVPQTSARLRFFLTAAHSEQQIHLAVSIVAEELAKLSSEEGSI